MGKRDLLTKIIHRQEWLLVITLRQLLLSFFLFCCTSLPFSLHIIVGHRSKTRAPKTSLSLSREPQVWLFWTSGDYVNSLAGGFLSWPITLGRRDVFLDHSQTHYFMSLLPNPNALFRLLRWISLETQWKTSWKPHVLGNDFKSVSEVILNLHIHRARQTHEDEQLNLITQGCNTL